MKLSDIFSGLLVVAIVSCMARQAVGDQYLYIASGKDNAIYRCTLNESTGEMTALVKVADLKTSFLALHPSLPVLYAASTDEKVKDQSKNGQVSAFEIESSGDLQAKNSVSTSDRGNTHVEVRADGSSIVLCHYCLLYTSPSPRDRQKSRMPSSA